MRRLLLISAIVVAACYASVGAAYAGVADAERRCEPGEEQVSLLAEASFTALLQAVTVPAPDPRCMAPLGEQADCQWHDAGTPSGPAPSWSPWSRDHWLPPNAAPPAPPRARAVWPGDVRVVLSDGYERELERPPRG